MTALLRLLFCGSGNRGAAAYRDLETGHAFAIEFLKSCDGTWGWAALVRWIVLDMIKAGPETNGIIVGFMGVIGDALAAAMTRPGQGGAA